MFIMWKRYTWGISWRWRSLCKSIFYKTVDKFIEWICDKFNFGDSKELIKKFENETRTLIDSVKQIKKEEMEKELDLER